ncbi:MAG: UvrD-helicase domain-containing protein [Candidatus Cryptobacteroides sp.]
MIQIMKASAGSGKTYSLVLRYIRILLERKDRYTYRTILAVTFTNKATDEMKERILLELHRLATDPSASPYRKEFVPSVFPSESQLQEKAREVLHDILHDYSAFSVSTIDRFFQQTLKAFSKEIGQFASYQVELDKDSLVAESVDRVLDSLTEDDCDLLSWLTKNVLDRIENGERYSLDANLLSMAVRLKSTQRQEALKEAGFTKEPDFSLERLEDIRGKCREITASFRRRAIEYASQALDILEAAGVRAEDSSYKFMLGLYDYKELSDKDEVPALKPSFRKYASEPEKWFSKAKSSTFLPLVYPQLEAPLMQLTGLFDKEYAIYNTARILDSQIYGLGLAVELGRTFNEIMKEKNVLCIDDSNTILRDIIDGSDAPFVYEKTGVRYEHFLLDEFQDTSTIQWENFRPLLEESESRGGCNLIVGDVKQSIYRWRGSDWNLLDKTVPEKFPKHSLHCLDTNWRSLGNIVRFNNAFFSSAAEVLDSELCGGDPKLSSIYADVEQKTSPKSDAGGSVSLTFCPKDAELDKVLESITQVRESGATYSDIAILVRSNAIGERVSEALTANGIPVITDDSLRVRSSLTVRRIVSLMSYAENPQDTVSGFLASSLNVELPQRYDSLEELAESLFRSLRQSDDEESWRGEALHIQSFFDCLQDYVASEGNNLRGFLKHFAEADPSISSPSCGDSVRVMTIHKSKGLDFNYVIIPFAENISFYKAGSHWCSPKLTGTALEGIAEGVYDVTLSSSCEDTLFADDYRKEAFLQLVDNMNILYVAMTRAVLGMHIIAKTPPAKCVNAVDASDMSQFKDFSQLLWWFVAKSGRAGEIVLSSDDDVERYDIGNIVSFNEMRKEEKQSVKFPVTEYGELPSFPLNPDSGDETVDVRERGRLKFSADSLDFFSEDGQAGISASNRIRGVVLHDIMSRVLVPADLGNAVGQSVMSGEMTSEEAEEVMALLGQRIAEGVGYGWFPEDSSKVLNETSIVDVDGSVHRPDRVIVDDGKVVIIDYKSGAHNKKYETQLRRYADIWTRMGYEDVSAFLWYLQSGEIRK